MKTGTNAGLWAVDSESLLTHLLRFRGLALSHCGQRRKVCHGDLEAAATHPRSIQRERHTAGALVKIKIETGMNI